MKNHTLKLVIVVMSVLISQASLCAMDKSKKQTVSGLDLHDISFEIVVGEQKKPLGVSQETNISKKSVDNKVALSKEEILKVLDFCKRQEITIDQENLDMINYLRDTVTISAGSISQDAKAKLTPEQEAALKAYAS